MQLLIHAGMCVKLIFLICRVSPPDVIRSADDKDWKRNAHIYL